MSSEQFVVYAALPEATGEDDVHIDTSTVVNMPLPAKYAVTFCGVATALYKQKVTVTLTNAQDDVVAKTILNKTSGSDFQVMKTAANEQSITWGPFNQDSTLKLAFQTEDPNTNFFKSVALKDAQGKQFSVTGYASYLNFATEDGGDSDKHDVNFNVMMVPVFK